MKKLSLLLALMCIVTLARAQSSTYHAFKVDLGMGYAIPAGDGDRGTKAGVTFTVEPHYRLSDDLAVGLRIEGAGLAYERTYGPGSYETNVAFLISYCPTIEYYLMNGSFRPLIGAGAGIFSQSEIKGDAFVSEGSRFGFFPRAGFEIGHLRLTVEYNIMGNSSNYVAFKISAFFGGGKK